MVLVVVVWEMCLEDILEDVYVCVCVGSMAVMKVAEAVNV